MSSSAIPAVPGFHSSSPSSSPSSTSSLPQAPGNDHHLPTPGRRDPQSPPTPPPPPPPTPPQRPHSAAIPGRHSTSASASASISTSTSTSTPTSAHASTPVISSSSSRSHSHSHFHSSSTATTTITTAAAPTSIPAANSSALAKLTSPLSATNSTSIFSTAILRGSSSSPDRRPSLRNLRRNSRTFPSLSLLSRLSSAAVGGTVVATTPPARAARRPSASVSTPTQHPVANFTTTPAEATGNLVAISVQTPPSTESVPPSYDPFTLPLPPSQQKPQNTASAAIRDADAVTDPAADKRRQLAQPASDSSHATPMHVSTQPEPRQQHSTEPDKKMHQTSSRLLRMTDDDRPFTRDFKDLFSTLMVSLPLTPHRVRFQKVDHTFTSEEAITNLGSLKFSQSNRMPDPKDPSRIVTTTTTTTFSMAKEMARSVCSKFLEARFIESVDGKGDFHAKNAVWQLTAKGMSILQGFCQRNGITAQHVMELLETSRNTMHLVILERESETDKIHRDQATIEVVFRRFVGSDGPNVKNTTTASDSDSLNDYQTGLVGVKMAQQRKIGEKTYWNTFTGKAAIDWLMDCCMMVDRRETVELASLFVEHGLMASIEQLSGGVKFSPSKNAIYQVTEKGKRVAGWVTSPKGSVNGDSNNGGRSHSNTIRDSNANRMTVIIRDPALRLLFREFLRDTHCEENLSFYLDVREFLNTYNAAKKPAQSPRLEVVRETLAAAYSLYNAFLAPGSPCELNIDHSLRTALAARMTRAVGDNDAMIKSLDEVATLFDQAQHSVFKLMASDSVPKFMREASNRKIPAHMMDFSRYYPQLEEEQKTAKENLHRRVRSAPNMRLSYISGGNEIIPPLPPMPPCLLREQIGVISDQKPGNGLSRRRRAHRRTPILFGVNCHIMH